MHSGQNEVFLIALATSLMVILAIAGVLVMVITDRSKRHKSHYKSMISENKLVERERQRISMDLHDQLGPELVLALRLLERSMLSNKDEEQYLAHAKVHLLCISRRLREITADMNDELIAGMGLQHSLQRLIVQYHRSIDIGFELDYQVHELLSRDLVITLFQVFRELINNTVKHSLANHARIIIKQVNNQLLCVYSDNGWLAQLAPASEGTGLQNIIDRISMLGGSCTLLKDDTPLCYFQIPI